MNTTTKTGVSMDSVDALGTKAANIAMQGAADAIRRRGVEKTIDVDKVVAALKRIAPGATLRALDDAREAYAVGMTMIGQATFSATMMAVGVHAVNEVLAGAV